MIFVALRPENGDAGAGLVRMLMTLVATIQAASKELVFGRGVWAGNHLIVYEIWRTSVSMM